MVLRDRSVLKEFSNLDFAKELWKSRGCSKRIADACFMNASCQAVSFKIHFYLQKFAS